MDLGGVENIRVCQAFDVVRVFSESRGGGGEGGMVG